MTAAAATRASELDLDSASAGTSDANAIATAAGTARLATTRNYHASYAPEAVSWLSVAFVAFVFGIPATLIAVDRILLRRVRAEWTRVADALGVRINAPAPELELSGTIDGVEIEIKQTVTYPYKQRPMYDSVA